MASSSSSLKRENPTTENNDANAKKQKISSSESEVSAVINPADCDLDFSIFPDGITGNALFGQGFAYCWSGARGNIGITTGKYCFGCRFLTNQTVNMKDTPVDQQHVSRVGISRGFDPVGNLGETENSFGYDGTGKFLKAGEEVEYGESFGEGDTIVCLVDLENKPVASLEFSKNGRRLGSQRIKVTDAPAGTPAWASAFFPHVLLKNTEAKFLFSMEHGEVFEGYRPWNSAVKDQNAILGPALSKPEDCEVIMMVGVSGSGKTTWAEKRVKEYPGKRYILIGTNLALDKMKFPGSSRKFDKDGFFDCVMRRANYVVSRLYARAAKVARNYIIDESNYGKNFRKWRLSSFQSFRKIAAVVFPKQEELVVRVEKRSKEIGKEDFHEHVYKMLAEFEFPMNKDMPKADEDFDLVIFTELSMSEAEEHLCEIKRYPPLSSSKNSKDNHSSNPRDSSVYSARMPTSLFGPEFPYLGYSGPLSGVQIGGSCIGRSEPAVQTNLANVNREHARAGEPFCFGSLQPYPNNVNIGYPWAQQPPFSNNVNNIPGSSVYSGRMIPSAQPYFPLGSLNPMPSTNYYPGLYYPVPGYNLAWYGSYYMHYPHGTYGAAYSYGMPGYGTYAQDQPPYVAQYRNSNPMPQRSYSADGRGPHRGTTPYFPPR